MGTTFYWGRCIIRAPDGGREREGVWLAGDGGDGGDIRWPGLWDVWDMRRMLSDASVRPTVWDTLHTPPSCIQVLTTNRKQKSNSVYLYFWNHSLTFLLSKYIIYILLEYIKYRIGTIPFILPEYFYSSNCCKEQLVCKAHDFSFF